MSALARITRFSSAAPTNVLRRLAQGRRRGAALRAGMMALAAAGIVVGGLEAAAMLLASGAPNGSAVSVAASPAPWTKIVRPIALFDLTGTEFAKLPASYRARRSLADDAREDVLTFGTLGTPKPFLQLSLLRVGSDGVDEAEELADGLARLAGLRGLTAARVRPGTSVDTRFGRFGTADLLLWDRGDATPCLGFRGPAEAGSVVRIAGFACGAPDRAVGRAALACALDRIDLLSAGEDDALRAVFVAAERRGGSACPASPALASSNALMAADQRHNWLDRGGNPPPFRGALFDVNGGGR